MHALSFSVVKWLGCWICNWTIASSIAGHHCRVTTLGKLFTPTCLCRSRWSSGSMQTVVWKDTGSCLSRDNTTLHTSCARLLHCLGRLSLPPSVPRTVNWISAFTLSNNNIWRWWIWIAAAYRWTHRSSLLAWSESWRPPGVQSAFIKCTGWTSQRKLWVTSFIAFTHVILQYLNLYFILRYAYNSESFCFSYLNCILSYILSVFQNCLHSTDTM